MISARTDSPERDVALGDHGLDVEELTLPSGRCSDLACGQSWPVPFLSLLAEPRVTHGEISSSDGGLQAVVRILALPLCVRPALLRVPLPDTVTDLLSVTMHTRELS